MYAALSLSLLVACLLIGPSVFNFHVSIVIKSNELRYVVQVQGNTRTVD